MKRLRTVWTVFCLLAAILAATEGGSKSEVRPPAFHAVIEPSRVVQVSANTVGVLQEVSVDRGDLVQKGQIIARLDFRVEQAAKDVAEARSRFEGDLKAAEIQREHTARRLRRQTALHEEGLLTSEELHEAERQNALAETTWTRAMEQKELADLEYQKALRLVEKGVVQCPMSGVVAERYLSPGETVQNDSDSPILRIAQLDPLFVEVHVPVEWLGRVKVGNQAEVHLGAPLDEVRTAEVVVVDRVLDAASGTFGVRLRLPNPDYQLPAGLQCTLQFVP